MRNEKKKNSHEPHPPKKHRQECKIATVIIEDIKVGFIWGARLFLQEIRAAGRKEFKSVFGFLFI